MKLLVIACPHSGTKYTAALLRHKGLDVPHETRIGAHGLVSWHYGVQTDNDPMLGHYSTDHRAIFDIIAHQVRHPVAFLRSSGIISRPQWEYIFAQDLFEPPADLKQFFNNIHTPQHVIPTAARLWIAWNRNCEALADLRYRVEDLGKHDNLVPRDIHSLKGDPRYFHGMTWAELERLDPAVAQEVATLSRSYGY